GRPPGPYAVYAPGPQKPLSQRHCDFAGESLGWIRHGPLPRRRRVLPRLRGGESGLDQAWPPPPAAPGTPPTSRGRVWAGSGMSPSPGGAGYSPDFAGESLGWIRHVIG